MGSGCSGSAAKKADEPATAGAAAPTDGEKKADGVGPVKKDEVPDTCTKGPETTTEGAAATEAPKKATAAGESVTIKARDKFDAAKLAWTGGQAGRWEAIKTKAGEEDGVVLVGVKECYCHYTIKYTVGYFEEEDMWDVKCIEKGEENCEMGKFDDAFAETLGLLPPGGDEKTTAMAAGEVAVVTAKTPFEAAVRAYVPDLVSGPNGAYESVVFKEGENSTVIVGVREPFAHFYHTFSVIHREDGRWDVTMAELGAECGDDPSSFGKRSEGYTPVTGPDDDFLPKPFEEGPPPEAAAAAEEVLAEAAPAEEAPAEEAPAEAAPAEAAPAEEAAAEAAPAEDPPAE